MAYDFVEHLETLNSVMFQVGYDEFLVANFSFLYDDFVDV